MIKIVKHINEMNDTSDLLDFCRDIKSKAYLNK
jgi:hypothetical protein